MEPVLTAERPPTVLRLAAPLVISFWMRSLFTLVDLAYVASISDEAVAAVGLAVPVEFVFIACWVGLSAALTSYLSKTMAAGEHLKFAQLVRTARKLTRILTGVFLLAGAVMYFAIPMIELEGAQSAEVARNFQIYATVLVAGWSLVGFRSIMPDSIVKAHHDTRSTMIAGILSNVTNLGLNTLFLFGFGWGIFGIALATGIGRLAGLLYARHRARVLEDARLINGSLSKPGMLHRPSLVLLKMAVPASLGWVLMSTESTLVNAFLAGHSQAVDAIAAYSIFHRVTLFSMMPMIAVSVAMLPYVARYFGAGRIDALKRALLESHMAAAAFVACVVLPGLWIGGPYFVDAMLESEQARKFARFAIFVGPFGYLLSVPFFLCRAFFDGLQRGMPGLIMAIARYLVLMVPAAYCGMALATRWGRHPFDGLVVGLFAASALVSLAFMVWSWLTVRALTAPPSEAPAPA